MSILMQIATTLIQIPNAVLGVNPTFYPQDHFALMMLLIVFLLSACSDTDLAEPQVYEILKNKSVIARHPFLELLCG
ncbi:MAG: hypothetical protein JJV98_10285 [Desulfosarcina sp.]|nr:hypothetical protein [Desulfobacterales bacterium]